MTYRRLMGGLVCFLQTHRDVSSEKPKFKLTNTALSESFKTDTSALGRYVDQALLVEGDVTSVEGNHVSLGNIICRMDSANLAEASALKTGDVVKIQGRLTSYNDLMEEVVMDNCVFK